MHKKHDGNRIFLKGDYMKLDLTKNIESHSYKMLQAKRPRVSFREIYLWLNLEWFDKYCWRIARKLKSRV